MKTLSPPAVWTAPEPFRTMYTHALEAAPGRSRWASDTPAAATVIVVAALARPDALVEVEVAAMESASHADAPSP